MAEHDDWPQGTPQGTPQAKPQPPDRAPARDRRTGRPAAAERIREQHRYVDLEVRRAIRRGDFDDLPGAGKPLPDLGERHDPDWWLKKLVERERITGVLPEALQLRKDDLELDARLDREGSADGVRRLLKEFNARVVAARRQLEGGPPVITPLRDVEACVAAWEARRRATAPRRQEERPARPRRRGLLRRRR